LVIIKTEQLGNITELEHLTLKSHFPSGPQLFCLTVKGERFTTFLQLDAFPNANQGNHDASITIWILTLL